MNQSPESSKLQDPKAVNFWLDTPNREALDAFVKRSGLRQGEAIRYAISLLETKGR